VEAKFQIFLILLCVLAGTALLARRTNVAPAILLLLAGIVLAFVPGMPSLELPPFRRPKGRGLLTSSEILLGGKGCLTGARCYRH